MSQFLPVAADALFGNTAASRGAIAQPGVFIAAIAPRVEAKLPLTVFTLDGEVRCLADVRAFMQGILVLKRGDDSRVNRLSTIVTRSAQGVRGHRGPSSEFARRR